MDGEGERWLVSQLEFNVPFQHKYGYIRDEERGGHTAAGILGNISAGFANEGPYQRVTFSDGQSFPSKDGENQRMLSTLN